MRPGWALTDRRGGLWDVVLAGVPLSLDPEFSGQAAGGRRVPGSHTVKERLNAVNGRIDQATKAAGRAPGSVRLLAVTKTQSADIIREAYALGLRDFGENYLQEAIDKQAQLQDLDSVVWHFIGPLQSNKARSVAEHFDWVHSVDRLDLAERLSRHRPTGLPDLSVCLQINISGEASKRGIEPSQLDALALAVSRLPRLKLRGLMTIPAAQPGDADSDEEPFQRLRLLKESLKMPLDTLSMGMSEDLEAAIHQGANWVRIGTALFGPRKR